MKKIYVDQWGNKYCASTVKELRSKICMGGSTVSKMYNDGKDNKPVHVGYVIGGHWLTCYVPFKGK